MSATPIAIFDSSDYDAEITRIAEALTAGQLLAMPTETVYGLAGLLSHPSARKRLSALRLALEPAVAENATWVPHLLNAQAAIDLLGTVTPFQRRLLARLWPGPVGLVFDIPESRRASIADALSAPQSDLFRNGSLTLRCPDHPVALDLLAALQAPLIITRGLAPHASGGQTLDELAPAALDAADLAVDSGPTRFNKPSTLLHAKPESYEILRAGAYDQRIIERMLKSTVLFVCSGNTCRSPMAWALARKHLAESLGVSPDKLEDRGVTVVSAGSFAVNGTKATPQAVEAARALGAELGSHRSKPLTVEMIHSADRIYTMSRSHLAAVLTLVPGARPKAQMLDPNGDIEDPIGSEVAVYRKLAEKLDDLIRRRLRESPLT
jgi:protein-tyrosine-phosphatase/tRNA A37 threonylcarbamoyladenosine synthetase subunit TsaC/SUA5/YrdC